MFKILLNERKKLMDLFYIWNHFLQTLRGKDAINSVELKKITGIPFIYITSTLEKNVLEEEVKKASAQAMRGKRLHSNTAFVRQEQRLYVYRHRFFVPQEKMFCCGNLCVDCVRLK
jgi:hypothetical protein